MRTEDRKVPHNATVRYNEVRPRKLLLSYPEAVIYLLKKYKTNAAIVKYNGTILHCMQPLMRTSYHFANDLIAESCKLADLIPRVRLSVCS